VTEHQQVLSENRHPEVYGRPFASLNEALRTHQIPLENWDFITGLTTEIGVSAYYGTASYIKAVRNAGAPDLHIHYGWTNGFRSEEEARHATGDTTSTWPSGRGTGQWGVTHPLHGHPSTGTRETRSERRDFGTCPRCNTQFSADGSCFCD